MHSSVSESYNSDVAATSADLLRTFSNWLICSERVKYAIICAAQIEAAFLCVVVGVLMIKYEF